QRRDHARQQREHPPRPPRRPPQAIGREGLHPPRRSLGSARDLRAHCRPSLRSGLVSCLSRGLLPARVPRRHTYHNPSKWWTNAPPWLRGGVTKQVSLRFSAATLRSACRELPLPAVLVTVL